MRKLSIFISFIFTCSIVFSQVNTQKSFHDTQGSIDVNGSGQLQFSLPVALPPAVKSVAPQINLVYTSGSGNGIAGYGWNLSGITAISRVGKNLDKDGKTETIKLDENDYFSFNGQRLILKSGEYGKDGAEYTTEKFSNVKIKSVGSLEGKKWSGPVHWEVSFEDGSQAWYGADETSKTAVEYNITKWRDAQGNYISYQYTQQNNVAVISRIDWGGNEDLNKPHFNQIVFNYKTRDLKESSYLGGELFVQDKILTEIVVRSNGQQFKKYVIAYDNGTNGTKYQFVKNITEYNSQNQPANPVEFEYEKTKGNAGIMYNDSRFDDVFGSNVFTGDFNGDGKLDFIRQNRIILNRFDNNREYINVNYKGKILAVGTGLKDEIILNRQVIFTGEQKGDFMNIYTYSLERNQLKLLKTNTFNLEEFDLGEEIINDTWWEQFFYSSEISEVIEGDFNGNGLSDLYLEISRKEIYQYTDIDPNLDYHDERIIAKKYFYVDLQNNTIKELSFRPDFAGDFEGNGKTDLFDMSNGNVKVYSYNNEIDNFDKREILTNISKTGLQKGDFNGDGKTDFMAPVGQGSSDWRMYISTGKGFKEYYYSNLFLYEPSWQGPPRKRRNKQRTYALPDLNRDGKSDFVIFESQRWYKDGWKDWNDPDSSYGFHYFRNNGVDREGKPIFELVHYMNPIEMRCGRCETLNYSGYGEHYVPIFGNFRIAQLNTDFIILHKTKLITWNMGEDIGIQSRIVSSTQGGLKTEIEYKELDPEKKTNFYAGVKSEKYPYMELDKVAQSYAVSQLRQEIAPNQVRKQDFRYRGFITHLQGKGMIGFRQTARSSWYGDGYENTKVWSGAEIDPLNEGLPIREWSIKTNNESEIFPNNLSFNNNQLLSFKETKYQIDNIQEGKIKAIVPIEVKTKDFIKDITSIDKVEYDEYYLPVKTISNTQNGFAEKITELSYYPPQLTGEGKDYSVGRPRSKTELVRAYGDSKGAKEEYEYENNLLKTLKTYNRDNSEYIQESYQYDGFGNIIEKTISNSIDNHTQTSKSKYDAKGRFVIEKTDNLGLITKISYNNWGQVLNQVNPLGDTLNFTYDAWGKVLTQRTNLGGTTQFTYEKLDNGDAKITEYAPDGGETITYTNKIGQNYKTTTKVFDKEAKGTKIGDIYIPIDLPIGIPEKPIFEPISDLIVSFSSKDKVVSSNLDKVKEGKYVSKEVVYDVLGRKIKESEPYFDGENVNQWNTIEYDEYSRPIKATAFTGKIVETEYTGNSVKITETNANGRFKKQVFDPIGNITTTEDKGGTIAFKYNAVGENIEAKYETNIVTTKYDEWGRKIEFHDPSNGLYKYEYNNGFGLLTKEISPKGYKAYEYNEKGQVIKQIEKSNDGTSTDKTIEFIYNNKGLLTEQKGFSKGKEFSTKITYDNYGRVKSTQEQSFGKIYEKKNIIYDNLSRVKSYEKSLTSSGRTTSVEIENIYDEATGILYQVKDKTRDKILWELEEHNAKGQITKAQLGGSKITNSYDTNGFLSLINHEFNNHQNLTISYSFNAIKNELNSRITGGDFNIVENFVYDDNNRLVNWTNPKTGDLHHNKYDKQGRILENDQLGKIKFENSQKIYQPTSLELNKNGEENLKNNLIQSISYNENNDPIFISGVKGDVSFEYGLSAMRQKVSFGGKIEENTEGKYTRYYSADGSFEITRDNETGEEKHILYIGGSPYESEIIFVKDYKEKEGSFKFLHKDYLGSILAISDEEGNKLEQRHYDAWGNLTHLQIGDGEIITDEEIIHNSSLIISRGYTSHEHFFEVGLIHMNGRLYDPLLRRFLNADENIQDPHNTQNYNKYGYVYNNPLMYNDPSGEFIWWVPAAVALFTHTVQSYYMNQPLSVEGLLQSVAMSYISAGIAHGLGEVFQSAKVVEALGKNIKFAKHLAHGVSGAIQSVMQGGNLGSGFLSGFLGSVGGQASLKYLGNSLGASTFTGLAMGGVGSVLVGGNFWVGAVTGMGVSVFNHYSHKKEIKDLIEKALAGLEGEPESNHESINMVKKRVRHLFNSEMKKYENKAKEIIDLITETKMPAEIKREKTIIYGEGNTLIARLEGNTTITYFKKAFSSWYNLGSTILHEYFHLADYYSGVGANISTRMYRKYGNTKEAAKMIKIELEKRAFSFVYRLGATWSKYENYKNDYE